MRVANDPAFVVSSIAVRVDIDEKGVSMTRPLRREVDAVTFRVPDLDSGIAFYMGRLGHALNWRNDDIEPGPY